MEKMIHESRQLYCGLDVHAVKTGSPLAHYQVFTHFGADHVSYLDSQGQVKELQPGSAHYFEHMLFCMPMERGIPPDPNPPTGESFNALTQTLLMGTLDVNAYTERDHTSYYFVTLRNREALLRLTLEMVLVPYMPQDEFDKEAGIILNEEAMYADDSDDVQHLAWLRQVYHLHGAKHNPVGTPTDIRAGNAKDMITLHKRFYCPSNLTLIASGNVDLEETCSIAEDVIEGLGMNFYQEAPPYFDFNEPQDVVQKTNFDDPLVRADIARPKLLSGFKHVYSPNLGRHELISHHAAMALAFTALFGEGSKSHERLVYNGIDEHSFAAELLPYRDHCEVILRADVDDPTVMHQLLLDTTMDARMNGLPKEEVEYAKRSLALSFRDADADLGALALNLARWGVLTKHSEDYAQFQEQIKHMDVQELNHRLGHQSPLEILNPEYMASTLMVPEE